MNKHYFFITGLPRSRTAWLANLLTWGDSFCFHDIDGGVGEVIEQMVKCEARHVGFSNPYALLCWRELEAAFPDSDWAVIRRNPKECFESSRKVFGNGYSPEFQDHLESGLITLVRTGKEPFSFAHLDEEVPELIAHLHLPPQPESRLDLLCKLNIQVKPKLLKRALAQPQASALA